MDLTLCLVGFLSVLCAVCGTQYALVEVLTASTEDDGSFERENASGAFTSIGAISSAEGDTVEMEISDLCSRTVTKPSLHPHGWVAVVSLHDHHSDEDSEFERERQKASTDRSDSDSSVKRTCSLVGQASRILLWGAAAVLFLSEQEEIPPELNGEQQVHHPVVVVLASYAIKAAQLLRMKNSRSRVQIYPKASSLWAGDISRVTLWTTCGPVRYYGTVCPESYHHKEIHVSYMALLPRAGAVLLMLMAVFVAFLVKVQIVQRRSVQQEERLEVALANLAREAVSKMPTQRYKKLHLMKFTRHYPFYASRKVARAPREMCSICLDEYSFRQVLRVLPCQHSFHRNCVDQWLITKRTCPLCKFNILEIFPDNLGYNSDDSEQSND